MHLIQENSFQASNDSYLLQNMINARTDGFICENKMEEDMKEMIQSLNESEIEIAAKSSYQYVKMQEESKNDLNVSLKMRTEKALKMAKRHLIACKGNKEDALIQMKKTIEFRKDMNIDKMMNCFSKKYIQMNVECSQMDDDKYTNIRIHLEKQMNRPTLFVRGYDKNDRSIMSIITRETPQFHAEYFIWMHIYMIERAIACTERKSNDNEEKIIIFFDMHKFHESHRPSLSMTKKLIYILRDHYPERMLKMYVMEAPTVFRAIWNLIKHFIDPVTKEKIAFLNGEKQKMEEISKQIDSDQAMPFMRPDGELMKPVNIKEFCYDYPFDKAYDEE